MYRAADIVLGAVHVTFYYLTAQENLGVRCYHAYFIDDTQRSSNSK